MSDAAGPTFQFVDEIPFGELFGPIGRPRSTPILVKGAVQAWPAWKRWTFEGLSELCRPRGKEVIRRFQDGLVEQGSTRPLPNLPVAPYLLELSRAAGAPRPAEHGLLPVARRNTLRSGQRFLLNWAHLQSPKTRRLYLADWPILEEFPELRGDFSIRDLWPGWRWSWEYVFIGPADTVTGLHQDIHNNWFCQVRGTKEVLLFPPEETPRMQVSGKYNLGSVLSNIDITRFHRHPEEAGDFGNARGLYARVEAGDALFIPKHMWHAVVALEPSISLGIFGLSLLEIATAGAWAEFKNVLHRLRLYRRGNCICHGSGVPAR